MKNFWKMDDFFPDRVSYAYLDHESYLADRIFIEKGICVKFIREMEKQKSPYRIVFCKVKKKDKEGFERALGDLENEICLKGYRDYSEYCLALEQQLKKETEEP